MLSCSLDWFKSKKEQAARRSFQKIVSSYLKETSDIFEKNLRAHEYKKPVWDMVGGSYNIINTTLNLFSNLRYETSQKLYRKTLQYFMYRNWILDNKIK